MTFLANAGNQVKAWGQGLFSIDPNSSPEQLERKRAMIAAMMPRGDAKYVGAGLADLAKGIAFGIKGRRMDKFEGEKRKEAADAFQAALGATPAPQGPMTVLGMNPDWTGAPAVAEATQQPAYGITPGAAGGAASPAFDLSSIAVGGATRPDTFTGMHDDFRLGLASMIANAPDEVRAGIKISSGYRSPERQQQLWEDALKKYGSPEAARKWVAPPGRSNHNHGKAADIKFTTDAAREWAHANAQQYNLAFPLSNEPWHIELASARGGQPAAQPAAQAAGQGIGGVPLSIPAYSGPPIADLQAALMNPWLSQGEKQIAASMLDRAMQQGDPAYQMQMQQTALGLQKTQMEIAQMGQPKRLEPIKIGDKLIDPTTYQVIGDYGDPNDPSRVPATFTALDMQARAGGLQPGTPEYQQFMLNGGAGSASTPAAFQALDLQAQAAGFQPGTEEYKNFMATRGSGLAAEASAVGKARGEATAAADGDYQAAQNALDLIDNIRNDPARGRATGKSALLNAIPGTVGYDFQLKVEQAKGGAFLAAVQQMRGLGALSQNEGNAATAAITRMNTAATEQGFLEALNDYEKIVRQGLDRAKMRGGGPVGSAPAAASGGTTAAAMSNDPLGLR